MNEPLQTYYIPFLIIASVIAICGAVIYAYIVNRKLSKTIDRLDSMIDKATDGEFKAIVTRMLITCANISLVSPNTRPSH